MTRMAPTSGIGASTSQLADSPTLMCALLGLAVVKAAEEANTKVDAALVTVEVVAEAVADIKAVAAFRAVGEATTMYNNLAGRDQGDYYGNQGSYYGGPSQGSCVLPKRRGREQHLRVTTFHTACTARQRDRREFPQRSRTRHSNDTRTDGPRRC